MGPLPLSSKLTMGEVFTSLWHLIPPSTFKNPCDYSESTQTIQDYLLILRSADYNFKSINSLLPCKVAYSRDSDMDIFGRRLLCPPYVIIFPYVISVKITSMHWKTKRFASLPLLQFSLDCSCLKLKLQYLQGIPVLENLPENKAVSCTS